MKTSKATLFYASRLLLIETRAMTITVRNVQPDNLYSALFSAGFRICSGWEKAEHKRSAQVQRIARVSLSRSSGAEVSGLKLSVNLPVCEL